MISQKLSLGIDGHTGAFVRKENGYCFNSVFLISLKSQKGQIYQMSPMSSDRRRRPNYLKRTRRRGDMKTDGTRTRNLLAAEAATRDHSDCDFNLTNVMFRSLNFHADFFFFFSSWAHMFRRFPERREIKFDLIFWFDYPINVWELKCYRSKRSRRE